MALPPALRPFVDDPAASAFFADFDGSLSPIVRDPGAAAVLPAARAALARLVPVLRTVVVVSGRPAAFLRDALDIDGLGYVGAYGLERIVDGEVVVDDRVRPWVGAIARAADEADEALPGLLVERKGSVAVTIHWRTQPDRGAEALRVGRRGGARACGWRRPLRGRMAVELRPPVPVDKGTTVADLARGASVAAFAGDDAGDLPAFAALHALERDGVLRHGVSIGVASAESPPEVHRGRRRGRRSGRPGGSCWTRSATRSARLVEQLAQPALRRVHRGELAQPRRARGAFVVGHRERGVQGVRALFDVVRVHGQRRVGELLVRTRLRREAAPRRRARLSSGPSLATRFRPSFTGFTRSAS